MCTKVRANGRRGVAAPTAASYVDGEGVGVDRVLARYEIFTIARMCFPVLAPFCHPLVPFENEGLAPLEKGRLVPSITSDSSAISDKSMS